MDCVVYTDTALGINPQYTELMAWKRIKER